MAVLRSPGRRATPQDRCRVPAYFPDRTSPPPLAVGAHVSVALLFCSLFATHSVRSSARPRLVFSSPVACPPSRFSHLPVCPSTRRPWPPPCVFEMGSLGESRFSWESAVVWVCREAGARVSTISSSEIWTIPSPTMTPVVWRSLRTGFSCSAEPNWHHVGFVGAGRWQTSPAVCSR